MVHVKRDLDGLRNKIKIKSYCLKLINKIA